MPKTIRLPFCDDLCTPIQEGPTLGLLGQLGHEAISRTEFERRFLILARHYNIDLKSDQNWRDRLIVGLILDFVPGLRTAAPTKRGRRPTISTQAGYNARRALLDAVEAKGPHHGDKRSCELVHKDWRKSPPDHELAGKSADYLRRQLPRARRERDAARTAMAESLSGFSWGRPSFLRPPVQSLANLLTEQPPKNG